MNSDVTTDTPATGTETSSRPLTSDRRPLVFYAGCLDSDPYFCLKQCDRVVVSELRERGVGVRVLQDELPKGKLFRKLNRKLLYPALVAKAARDQRSGNRSQGSEISSKQSFDSSPPPSSLPPATCHLPPVLHIGSQCYANLIPIAQSLKPKACIPVSITVHDLAEHYFPQDLTSAQMRRWRKRTARLKQADLIFSVSQHTKNDLIQIFGIPGDKIAVNYNGVDSEFRVLEAEALEAARNALCVKCQGLGFRGDDSGEKRFNVLAVGADLYRKNLPTLIKAAEELARRGVPVTLIKVGDPIPQHLKPNTEHLKLNTEHLKPNTEHLKTINLGHVSKAELIALYNLCDVLAFPSLYEGFGMPVVEAQRCGLPSVISNAASLPEIGGEGALYHDPLDVEGLADQLQRVYTDDALRNELREKGFRNAQRFAWQKHVDTLMEFFGTILQPLR